MQLLSFQILLFVFWVLQVSVQNILLRLISFAVGGYSKLDFLALSGILEACIREKTTFVFRRGYVKIRFTNSPGLAGDYPFRLLSPNLLAYISLLRFMKTPHSKIQWISSGYFPYLLTFRQETSHGHFCHKLLAEHSISQVFLSFYQISVISRFLSKSPCFFTGICRISRF